MTRATVFPVAGPWTGRLGIVPRPRGGDWLADEAVALRDAGVNMVVSLLEPDEAAQLDLNSEASALASQGLTFQAFPIPDRGVPASRDSVAQFARAIVYALRNGANVVVHCRQSFGRSGMIVAAILVTGGVDLLHALKAIEKSRGLEVPETDEQRRWLADFASWCDSAPAVRR
ncbi:MAG: tyrosine protein phosphatase [Cyanobacteria bacterium]|nr:tyrosine protein phosphatase [Cyanobacteriota bacterium]